MGRRFLIVLILFLGPVHLLSMAQEGEKFCKQVLSYFIIEVKPLGPSPQHTGSILEGGSSNYDTLVRQVGEAIQSRPEFIPSIVMLIEEEKGWEELLIDGINWALNDSKTSAEVKKKILWEVYILRSKLSFSYFSQLGASVAIFVEGVTEYFDRIGHYVGEQKKEQIEWAMLELAELYENREMKGLQTQELEQLLEVGNDLMKRLDLWQRITNEIDIVINDLSSEVNVNFELGIHQDFFKSLDTISVDLYLVIIINEVIAGILKESSRQLHKPDELAGLLSQNLDLALTIWEWLPDLNFKALTDFQRLIVIGIVKNLYDETLKLMGYPKIFLKKQKFEAPEQIQRSIVKLLLLVEHSVSNSGARFFPAELNLLEKTQQSPPLGVMLEKLEWLNEFKELGISPDEIPLYWIALPESKIKELKNRLKNILPLSPDFKDLYEVERRVYTGITGFANDPNEENQKQLRELAQLVAEMMGKVSSEIGLHMFNDDEHTINKYRYFMQVKRAYRVYRVWDFFLSQLGQFNDELKRELDDVEKILLEAIPRQREFLLFSGCTSIEDMMERIKMMKAFDIKPEYISRVSCRYLEEMGGRSTASSVPWREILWQIRISNK